MSELPEDAIEAAAQALCDKYAQDEQLVGKAWREISRVDAETALAAALPFLERAIRDKIADEIERTLWNFEEPFTRLPAMAAAARVARGGEATQ